MARRHWERLKGLSARDRELLDGISEGVEFCPGDRIVVQGQPLDALIVIQEGRVGVRQDYKEAHIDVTVLGPGDPVGEMSFVTGEPPNATVVAVDPGRCVRVPRSSLEQLLVSDPQFGSRFYRALAILIAERLRDTTARLPRLDTLSRDESELPRRPGGRSAKEGGVPEFLVEAVDRFKRGMHRLEARLADRRAEPADREEVSGLIADLKTNLNRAVGGAPTSGTDCQAAGSYVFRETFPFFMLSSLIDRSFTKPKGRACDYLTLEQIYRARPSGRGEVGRLIDEDFLASPVCRALRDRRNQLAGCLKRANEERASREERFRVTGILAGAGRELFDFVDTTSDRDEISATLFDTEVDALSFSDHLARERHMRHQVVLARESVAFLVEGKAKTHVPEQDVVYSPGALDYLDDAQGVQLLNWIHDHLRVGGTCFLCNFGASNPDRHFMSHILDWHARHRSADDVVRLFANSKFGTQELKVKVGTAGANLLAECRRPL